MANNKTPLNLNGAAAIVSVAAAVLPQVKPAIDIVQNLANKAIDEHKTLTVVPELYSKGFLLTKDQAEILLKESNLNSVFIPLSLAEASEKYRDCFEDQVITSQPRSKAKVEPGKTILVKYVPKEVIEKSKILFEESEKQKKEIVEAKREKHNKQKEKTKEFIGSTIIGVKNSVVKTTSTLKTKIREEKAHE